MASPATPREVRIPSEDGVLSGDLTTPDGFEALVVFAHADGSGRHNARNRQLAARLQQAGIATLLFDTPGGKKHDDLLSQRLQDITAWLGTQPALRHATVGFVGCGAGGSAALIAAARLGREVTAVVSLAGRVDLAGPAVLAAIKASTLLVVGGDDDAAVEMHEQAYQHLRGERSLAVAPGAGPLFEDTGGVDDHAADMAVSWFTTHMVPAEHEA
jgi:putative phosphoribosyl transferase